MSEPLQAALVGAERADGDLDATEQQINALIERRATDRERANAEVQEWKASVAAHNAAHRKANRYAWETYYLSLSRAHKRLSEDLQRRAEEVARIEV